MNVLRKAIPNSRDGSASVVLHGDVVRVSKQDIGEALNTLNIQIIFVAITARYSFKTTNQAGEALSRRLKLPVRNSLFYNKLIQKESDKEGAESSRVLVPLYGKMALSFRTGCGLFEDSRSIVC